MAASEFSSIKRNAVLGAAVASALCSCASVEYTSETQMTAVQTVVPMPKPAATFGYAAPATTDANAGAPLAAQPAVTALVQPPVASQAAAATVAATADYATKTTDYAVNGSTVLTAPVLQAAADAQPMAAAYADMPMTAEMMAIQSVIPTPKPGGSQLAYAAAPTTGTLSYASAPAANAFSYPSATAMDSLTDFDTRPPTVPELEENAKNPFHALISKYSKLYEVPEALVHRVVRRESNYNPKAFSRGNYGLMQIRYNTARGLGYDGTPAGLFDAETNLKYAVKYLRGAWLVADANHDGAVRLYARGYYYDAKRKGLLDYVQ